MISELGSTLAEFVKVIAAFCGQARIRTEEESVALCNIHKQLVEFRF